MSPDLLSSLMPSWMQRLRGPTLTVVVIIWLAGVFQGFAQAQASATLPFTRAGLGLSQGEMSLLLGITRLAAFAALPLGWMGDHKGRKKPFLIAFTLVIAGGTIAGLSMDAWQFGAAQAVLRTGTAAMSGLALVLLAEKVSPTVRAYAISAYGAAISFGSGIALMTLPLADGGGESWRTPYLLVGVGVLVLPFLIRFVPESEIFVDEKEHKGHWRDLVKGMWSRRFWTVLTVGFLASSFSSVALAFSTERMINEIGFSTGTTVAVSLVGGTIGGIGFFVGGYLANVWGRRNTSALSLLMAAGGGLVLYWSTSIPVIIAGVVVSSFGIFAFVPAAGSHRTELFPTSLRASALTANANFGLAGSAAGLILGIYTIDRFGLSRSVTALGVGVIVAALLTMTLPETKCQDLTAVETARL